MAMISGDKVSCSTCGKVFSRVGWPRHKKSHPTHHMSQRDLDRIRSGR